MRGTLLRLLLTLGLALGAVAGVTSFASAGHEHIAGPGIDGDASSAHAYFPWVPRNAQLDGIGAMHGTVTVQNLEPTPAMIDLFVEGEYNGTAILLGNATATWDAGELEVAAPGGAVEAHGYLHRGVPAGQETVTCQVGGQSISLDGFPGDAQELCEAFAGGLPGHSAADASLSVDTASADVNAEYARIAGAMKQAGPAVSVDATTSGEHVTVEGYSALSGDQVHDPAGEFSYALPIVQTNSGWNTIVRVASFADGNDVTVTLYEAADNGGGGESGAFSQTLNRGDAASYDISDDVPEGWVGTAIVTASGPAGAVADRYNPDENMLLNNESKLDMASGGDTQYASLVFQDYNHWNTGISLANTSDGEITVTVDYLAASGETPDPDVVSIPAGGMGVVYHPGTGEMGLDGFVGSAILSSDGGSFHAAVDQVKYFGDDEDVGQAMSYVLEHAPAGDGELLAAPLMQRGDPHSGDGDTSGFQLFNVDSSGSVTAEITVYDRNGNPAAPTDGGPLEETIPAGGSHTVYAHELEGMPVGFQGAAVVEVSGEGGLVGVMNNVNYAVQADGSAAFGLVRAGEGDAVIPDPDDDADDDGNGADDGPDIEVEVISHGEPDGGFLHGDVLQRLRASILEELNFPLPNDADPHRQDIYEFLLVTDSQDFVSYVEDLEVNQVISEDDASVARSVWVFTALNFNLVEVEVSVDGEPVDAGIDLELRVRGANEIDDTSQTQDGGIGEFMFHVSNPGEDTIEVTADVHGDIGTGQKTVEWRFAELEPTWVALSPIHGFVPYGEDLTMTGTLLDQFGIILEWDNEDIEFIASTEHELSLRSDVIRIEATNGGVAEFTYSRSQGASIAQNPDEITARHLASGAVEVEAARIIWDPDLDLPDVPDVPFTPISPDPPEIPEIPEIPDNFDIDDFEIPDF